MSILPWMKEQIVKYGTLVIAGMVPFVCFGKWIYPHTTSKTFLLYGIVVIIGAIWTSLLLSHRAYRLSRRDIFFILPLLGYVLWMTIASITAKNTGLAFWGIMMRGTGVITLYMLTLYALIVMSVAKRWGEAYRYMILKWIVTGGLLVTLSVWLGDEGFNLPIGVLQKASGGGVTGNSSLAGAYLLIILGFAVILGLHRAASKRAKTIAWITSGLILFSPLFINVLGLSRGAILGSARGAFLGIFVGIGVSLCVILTLSKKQWQKYLGIGGIAIGIIVFSIAWIQLLTPTSALHSRFVAAASGTRFVFWEISSKAMHERPLVGYGPENFSIAQQEYFDPRFLSKELAYEASTDHPHNIYFDTGVSAGYPGIILYALFFASLIYLVYKRIDTRSLSVAERAVLIGIPVSYIFQALFSPDSIQTWLGVILTTAYVYACSTNQSQDISEKKTEVKEVIGWVLIVLSIPLIIIFAIRPSIKAAKFGKIIGASLNVRSTRYSELLAGSAVGSYWDVSAFAYDEYKLYAKNPVAVKQDQKVLPYAIKDVDSYISYLEAVTKINKTDYRLYFTLVNFYNTKIYFSDLPYDPTLAQHIQELIGYTHMLSPTDPRVYWLYAQLAAWKGDMAAVIDAYQKGIAIDPTLPVSHELLLKFLKGIGNNAEYTKALLAAKAAIPNFSITP